MFFRPFFYNANRFFVITTPIRKVTSTTFKFAVFTARFLISPAHTPHPLFCAQVQKPRSHNRTCKATFFQSSHKAFYVRRPVSKSQVSQTYLQLEMPSVNSSLMSPPYCSAIAFAMPGKVFALFFALIIRIPIQIRLNALHPLFTPLTDVMTEGGVVSTSGTPVKVTPGTNPIMLFTWAKDFFKLPNPCGFDQQLHFSFTNH